MKHILHCIFLLTTLISVSGQDKKAPKITMDALWTNYSFYATGVPGFNFMEDGVHYLRVQDNKIVSNHLITGVSNAIIFDASTFKGKKGFNGNVGSYLLSEDERFLMIPTEKETIYRHSYLAKYYYFDRTTEAFDMILKEKISNPSFSSSGDKVAYIYKNNLFVKNLESQQTDTVTHNGAWNQVINGQADWVYEEEFGFTKAYEWNADDTHIAYLEFDETDVKEFTMTNYFGGLYPEYQTFKYPKVGEKNSKVKAYVYDVTRGKKVAVPLKNYEYIARIKWTPDPKKVLFYTLNRHQNTLRVELFDLDKQTLKTIVEEKSKYYVDVHDNLTFVNDDQFLWTSEKSGYNQLYLCGLSGGCAALTTGNKEVTNVYGFDKKNKTVYYQLVGNTPMDRSIASIHVSTKQIALIESGTGTNNAQFSSTYDYYVHNYSTINSPPVYTVKDRKKVVVRPLVDNNHVVELMDQYQTSHVDFIQVPTSDGVKLNGYMIKPANFNPKQTYPVFMYVYGGPGSQTVKNSWGGQNYWWFQSLVQEGYIVVSVDNRGTGARGEEFKKMTYLQLGKYEIEDQINVAKWLGDQPYVDAARIGMFGWSYGGYMSSLAITKGANVFKMAIAVAPVTNWKWYDSIYTERYMQTMKENEKGYSENSPVNFTHLIKGKYLIVHGNSDDNVHFQHAAEMVRNMISNDVQFETYFYPNRNHGIYGDNARKHLFTKMSNFVLENL